METCGTHYDEEGVAVCYWTNGNTFDFDKRGRRRICRRDHAQLGVEIQPETSLVRLLVVELRQILWRDGQQRRRETAVRRPLAQKNEIKRFKTMRPSMNGLQLASKFTSCSTQ